MRMKVPSQSKLTELRRTFRTALGPSRRVHLFEISVYKSYGVHDRHVMGRLFLSYLDGRVYCCRLCKTHLARLDELISKVVFHQYSIQLSERSISRLTTSAYPTFAAFISVIPLSTRKGLSLQRGRERHLRSDFNYIIIHHCSLKYFESSFEIVHWTLENMYRATREQENDDRNARGRRHILRKVLADRWLEIRELHAPTNLRI